jgi:hypothetical protein
MAHLLLDNCRCNALCEHLTGCSPPKRLLSSDFDVVDQAVNFRIAMIVNANPQNSAPSAPTSGSMLAVFGNSLGAGSALATCAGVGAAITIRIGTSCLGAGGGGGIVPVRFTC